MKLIVMILTLLYVVTGVWFFFGEFWFGLMPAWQMQGRLPLPMVVSPIIVLLTGIAGLVLIISQKTQFFKAYTLLSLILPFALMMIGRLLLSMYVPYPW